MTAQQPDEMRRCPICRCTGGHYWLCSLSPAAPSAQPERCVTGAPKDENGRAAGPPSSLSQQRRRAEQDGEPEVTRTSCYHPAGCQLPGEGCVGPCPVTLTEGRRLEAEMYPAQPVRDTREERR